MGDMTKLKENMEAAAAEELESANKKYPMFHSEHEASGVILEEYQETREAVDKSGQILENFWRRVRSDAPKPEKEQILLNLYDSAIQIAAEACQLAAMARKGINSMNCP